MPGDKVACGRFLKPFGLRGELKFDAWLPDDFPPDRFTAGYVSAGGGPEREIYIVSARPLGGGLWAVRPDGCGSPEEAKIYVNADFLVSRRFLPDLGENEYLAEDIIGCAVFDEAGKGFGVVAGIMETGANDVWELAMPDGREVLIPATEEVVKLVDVINRRIVIHPLSGLFD